MKLRRRDTEVFSLSFLDVICCGFGAVIRDSRSSSREMASFNCRATGGWSRSVGREIVSIWRAIVSSR